MRNKILVILIGIFVLALPDPAQATLLHEFSWLTDNGRSPKYGKLVLSGTTLYGTTVYGGSNGSGTIYKIQTNGTGFTLLHSFAGGTGDGNNPYGSLLLSGTTLYGMTYAGGGADKGTIFKIQTGGTGFQVLHEFAGAPDDGRFPSGSLILDGSTLYGMTGYGGANDKGTVFKIQTSGTGFFIIHDFADGTTDGRYPEGSLVLSGSTVYGMTPYAGLHGLGTVFKVETNGSDFSLLHSFAGGVDDGQYPYGSLALSGSTLYGMASMGGDDDKGLVFKIGIDGLGFALLHEFAGGSADGASPSGSPVISGTFLYGTTAQGGGEPQGYGTVFRLALDGGGYAVLNKFAGGTGDGANPSSDVLIAGSAIYGTTYYGGDSDVGVVFSLPLPPGLDLVSPNGGEHWTLGTAKDITWTATNYTGTVRLVLFKGTTRFGDIASGISATAGSYAWTVGQCIEGTATEAANYRVYVRSTDNTIVDMSDYKFSLIDPAQLQVITPNGGESWTLGKTKTIAWKANGYGGLVRLVLFKNTKKIGQIASNIPASQGTYPWTVGAYEGGTAPAGILYSIRLLASDGSQDDFSNGPFTITDGGALIADHLCTDIKEVPEEWLAKAHDQQRVLVMSPWQNDTAALGLRLLGSRDPRLGVATDDIPATKGMRLHERAWQPKGAFGFDLSDWRWSLEKAALESNATVVVVKPDEAALISGRLNAEGYLTVLHELAERLPAVKLVCSTVGMDEPNELVERFNRQVREHVLQTKGVLLDTADIESWRNGDQARQGEMPVRHPAYRSESAPSEENLSNQGAAAWWLLARLSGWQGSE